MAVKILSISRQSAGNHKIYNLVGSSETTHGTPFPFGPAFLSILIINKKAYKFKAAFFFLV